MKIKRKDEPTKTSEEYLIDNKVDLMKHATIVHARGIRKDISSDLILAKIGEDKEEPIIELTEQAYFGRRLGEKIINRAYTYKWNDTKKVWIKKNISQDQQTKIDDLNKATFDSYLTGPNLYAVLRRNKPHNNTMTMISGFEEEQPPEIRDESNQILEELDNKIQKRKER